MRLELVLQGIEQRVQGELGVATLPVLGALPAARDIAVNLLAGDVPKLNVLVADAVTFLEGGEAGSGSGTSDEDKQEPHDLPETRMDTQAST